MSLTIHKDKCIGCTLCVKACPFGALSMIEKKAVVKPEVCTLCGACVDVCKFSAITLKKEKTAVAVDASAKGVWVFCEQKHGVVQSVAYELLSKGRELADKLDVELCGVLLGHGVEASAQDIIYRGADTVYVVDHPALKNFLDDPYTAVMVRLIKKHKPEIVLCGATSIGRSLISRVAVKIHTGLTADCTGLDIDPHKKILLQTRPAFGGNIMATIITPNHRPQMSTVRHKVMKEATPDLKRKGRVVSEVFEDAVYASRTKVIDIVEEVIATVNIAEADIIRRPRDESARKLQADRTTRPGFKRRSRGFPRRGRFRMDPVFASGGPDRQDRLPQALHRLRHLGPNPASRRHAVIGYHHRRQQ
jgi:electron transfer flavoprotein alpha subunit